MTNCRVVRLVGLAAGAALMMSAQPRPPTMAFTMSMERPSTHYYRVKFRTEALEHAAQDFKMPVWMPGYYSIQEYSKNVVNFKAADGAGKALSWSQSAKNIWHVTTGTARTVIVTYDVYGFTRFVGSTYLDDRRRILRPRRRAYS